MADVEEKLTPRSGFELSYGEGHRAPLWGGLDWYGRCRPR